MRTRLIRPEFFEDEVMADLPDAIRLTYIGLWCVADDDGYFNWRPRQVAAQLYPYDPPRTRERRMVGQLDTLEGVGRVRRLECGQHGLIPSLPRHRIQGGRPTFPIRDKHRTCVHVQSRADTSHHITEAVSVSVHESVSDSGRSGASEFKERMERNGLAIVPKKTA